MKKLALLIAVCLCAPTFSRASDTVAIECSNPGADKTTSVNIVFPKGTAWEAGDLVSITFDANESVKIEKKDFTCGDAQNRRFNPGNGYWSKCKESPYEQKFSKTYSVSYKDKMEIQYLNELQDSWIPGFLMPMIPANNDAAISRIEGLFRSVTVNGIPSKVADGCKIISTTTSRTITIAIPQPVAVMKEMIVTIPTSFGIICPLSKGSYSIKVDSKASGSTSLEVVDPMIINPKFEINPKFPGESAVWNFSFQLSKAGRLEQGSQVVVRLPKGFGQLQSSYHGFSVELNGFTLDKNMTRIGQGSEFDQLLVPCVKSLDAGSTVSIAMNVINPGEGEVTCQLFTTSDTLPVAFGPEKIEFSQIVTSTETTAGLPTSIFARFKSEGHKAHDNLLAILPSEINKGCKVSLNGQLISHPTLGLKTVQFELPADLPVGAFCMLQLSDVLNPLENSIIKVSITNSTFEVPWNVTPYQSKLTVSTIPPIANKPCSYVFHITPPPDLLDVERKQITIVGPWNKIIRPVEHSFLIPMGEATAHGTFDSKTNTMVVKLDEEFPNMKPITLEIPISAGFGSPDASSEFTVKISGKEMKSICKVMPAPPVYTYSMTTKSGQDYLHSEGGWSNEPITVEIFSSSGKSDITVSGLEEIIKSTKSDLKFTIDKTIITEELPVSVSDVGGISQFSLPPIKIDMDELKLNVTNPFEKTGISPTPNLIIGIETNRKIIPFRKEFMVIEPEIKVTVNELPEASIKLNSKIENAMPETRMNLDLQVILRNQINAVKITVTDQAGRSKTSEFSVKLEVKSVTLELDAKQSQAVDPGMNREIVYKTDPETTVLIGEKTYKADLTGKVKVKLDIVPGYNVFFTQLISKENVSYEYQVFIFGKRSIRMKSEQKFVFVDGKKIDIKVPPTTITYKFKVSKGKDISVPVAYAPLRVLAENLFASVAYDSATKQITIIQKRPDKDRKIIFTVDSPTAIVDGQPYPINNEYNIPTIIKNGSAMIPMRFAATQLGAKVGFDDKTKEILIDWPDPNVGELPKQGASKKP